MTLVPNLLGAIGTPFQLAYKLGRLFARLKDNRQPLAAADSVASFLLDVKGKARVGLAWLVIKFVHASIRCTNLADKTYTYLQESLHLDVSTVKDEVLAKRLDNHLSRLQAGVPDKLTYAGVIFVRDCLNSKSDEQAGKRFARDGKVDVLAALNGFYSTPSCTKLADVLAEPGAPPGSRQNMLDKVYEDLRLARRRAIMDMLIL